MITAIGKLLFSLFAMHFALDYPFQGDTTAVQNHPSAQPLSRSLYLGITG